MRVDQRDNPIQQHLLFDDALNRSIKKMTDPRFMNPTFEELERKYANPQKKTSPNNPYKQLEMVKSHKDQTNCAVCSEQLTAL